MDVEATRPPESSSRKLIQSPEPEPPPPPPPPPPAPPQPQRSCCRWRCICLSVTVTLLALGLLLLILGLTVFRPRRPTTTVTSIALNHLDYAIDLSRLRVFLNASLDVVISIHNPNRVGYRYHGGNAVLRHRRHDVGEVPVPAGRIGARDTRSLHLTLALMGDRVASDSTMFRDVTSGTVPIQVYIRVVGKVRILFSIHVTVYVTCDLDIFLANRTISHLKCHYRTKL